MSRSCIDYLAEHVKLLHQYSPQCHHPRDQESLEINLLGHSHSECTHPCDTHRYTKSAYTPALCQKRVRCTSFNRVLKHIAASDSSVTQFCHMTTGVGCLVNTTAVSKIIFNKRDSLLPYKSKQSGLVSVCCTLMPQTARLYITISSIMPQL